MKKYIKSAADFVNFDFSTAENKILDILDNWLPGQKINGVIIDHVDLDDYYCTSKAFHCTIYFYDADGEEIAQREFTFNLSDAIDQYNGDKTLDDYDMKTDVLRTLTRRYGIKKVTNW